MKKFIIFLKSKNIHKNLIISKLYMFFKKSVIEPLICVLRYHLIYNPRYEIKKKINFGDKVENKFFLNELRKSNIYLEYGSGNSTLKANQLKKKIFSVESDKNFFNFLNRNYKINQYILRDLGYVKYYSIPLFFNLRKKLLKKKAIKYSNDILVILDKKKIIPNLILIDGRYRVLTALFLHKFFYKKKNKFLIIIDDYKERKFYHVIEKFFIVKLVGRFGILNKVKKNNPSSLIKKYSEDYR